MNSMEVSPLCCFALSAVFIASDDPPGGPREALSTDGACAARSRSRSEEEAWGPFPGAILIIKMVRAMALYV